MRVFESQLWTPKGRCEATRIFVTGRWISNLSCIGTCPKTFQSIWSLYDVFSSVFVFLFFFDVPCCVRRYWVMIFFLLIWDNDLSQAELGDTMDPSRCSVPRCQGLLSSKQLDPALRGALHSLKAVKVKAASDDTKPGTQSLVAAVSLVKWLGFMQ